MVLIDHVQEGGFGLDKVEKTVRVVIVTSSLFAIAEHMRPWPVVQRQLGDELRFSLPPGFLPFWANRSSEGRASARHSTMQNTPISRMVVVMCFLPHERGRLAANKPSGALGVTPTTPHRAARFGWPAAVASNVNAPSSVTGRSCASGTGPHSADAVRCREIPFVLTPLGAPFYNGALSSRSSRRNLRASPMRDTDPDLTAQTPDRPPDDRLESWKEIATYLGKDASTVQRWEKRAGLPVHRHADGSVLNVYAYRSELDGLAAPGSSPALQPDRRCGR